MSKDITAPQYPTSDPLPLHSSAEAVEGISPSSGDPHENAPATSSKEPRDGSFRSQRKALHRKTTRIYRNIQQELHTLFDRADDESLQEADTSGDSLGLTASKTPRVYHQDWSIEPVLKDGTPVIIRLLMAEDRERLQDGFERLSAESVYQRFMTSMSALPESYLRYFTDVDHEKHFAVGAAIRDPAKFDLHGIGTARFIALSEQPKEAELAITITDEAQGLGLGKRFMTILLEAAEERGYEALQAEVLPGNLGMQKLAESFGGYRIESDGGMIRWRIPINRSSALSIDDKDR